MKNRQKNTLSREEIAALSSDEAFMASKKRHERAVKQERADERIIDALEASSEKLQHIAEYLETLKNDAAILQPHIEAVYTTATNMVLTVKSILERSLEETKEEEARRSKK